MNKKHKIAIVDDEPAVLSTMEALLYSNDYDLELIMDGNKILENLEDINPDVILLDVMMPGINGFEITKKIKSNKRWRHIPIILITALDSKEDLVRGLEVGAEEFLTKPVKGFELRARVYSMLKIKDYHDQIQNYQDKLKTRIKKKTAELLEAYKEVKEVSMETIYRLSMAAEYKDEDTGSHIQRMSRYSAAIAKELGFTPEKIHTILYASQMHDIGKIGIPDKILLKEDKLDIEEWEIMKSHTEIGQKILTGSKSDFISLASIIAYTHHEKWDGSGYPRGIKGKKIPAVGRIIAVADVFDALSSNRPYKKAFALEESLKIIEEGRGTHFDPEIVDAFMSIKKEIITIKDKFHDTNISLLFQKSRVR